MGTRPLTVPADATWRLARPAHALRTLLRAAAWLATLACAPHAWSACVSSFVDIPVGAPYCDAAEWLKQRKITLGCTDSAHYCPNDAVTRASMALFLNRLGTALRPTFLHALGADDVPAGTQVVTCQTAPYTVTGYPRAATGDASAYFWADEAGAGLAGMRLVYSLDGGSTWTNWASFRIYTEIFTTYSSSSSTAPVAYFDPGDVVIFGVQLLQTAKAYHQGCEMRVRIDAAE